MSNHCSFGDNSIVSRFLKFVKTRPNIFCIFGQFIPFGGLYVSNRVFRRLQGLYYFRYFFSVGDDKIFIHTFIIAKKQKNCNKSVDNRPKRVYDIRVIDIR